MLLSLGLAPKLKTKIGTKIKLNTKIVFYPSNENDW